MKICPRCNINYDKIDHICPDKFQEKLFKESIASINLRKITKDKKDLQINNATIEWNTQIEKTKTQFNIKG